MEACLARVFAPYPRVVSASAQQGLSLHAGGVRCARSGHPGWPDDQCPLVGQLCPYFLLEAFHGTVLDESNVEEKVTPGFSVGPQTAQPGSLLADPGAPQRPHPSVGNGVV